ncbi:hypothetical protein JFT81_07135 [Pseudomonas sp. TH43]|uniref:hypothetical protein n=1 Tax=Pseudomonas sp. TH43 TaxID=2796407 RepID=UPI001912DF8F|nr:hypothetical protein [Pseudomonas sp. TH43]MBK5374404.1 hypothetical protein [Pseudomonas sp. TH43]
MSIDFDLRGPRDLGLIRAGMTRDDARSALESPFDEFLKGPGSVVPTDAYDDLGLHVYFDDALMVVGVEFLKWAQFTWRGQRLAGEEVLVVQLFLTGQGELLVFNNSGFNVERLGLRFYAPDIGEEGAIVEAVYVDFTGVD